MRASELEFRHRFWFIGGIFWLGFGCYALDHRNTTLVLADLLWRRKFVPYSAESMRPLHVLLAFAALLCVLAAALRTWAAAYLRSEIVHDHALHAEGLVADGPFRRVRNPLYDGGLLLAAGMGFLASPLGWAVMVLGLLIFYYRLVLREEAALTITQGESFRAYRAAVPRFLPALRPRVKASGAKPRWSQAFAGEIFMWGFATSVIAFAATLNLAVFYGVLGLSLIGYMVYWISRRHATKQKTDSLA